MNVDVIFSTLGQAQVSYLLIGGMNFLLRHSPELTFDVDIWVEDEETNLHRLASALCELGAAWGPTESTWAPTPPDGRWLTRQSVFCLTTDHGALDVFREVVGLEAGFATSLKESSMLLTASGVPFRSLSDQDMLRCQEALPERDRKLKRMEILRAAIIKPGTR